VTLDVGLFTRRERGPWLAEMDVQRHDGLSWVLSCEVWSCDCDCNCKRFFLLLSALQTVALARRLRRKTWMGHVNHTYLGNLLLVRHGTEVRSNLATHRERPKSSHTVSGKDATT